MDKEFVPYELALRMKKLGFDEPCFNASNILSYHQKSIGIPIYQQAFRWFREKYGLFTQPNITVDKKGIWYYFSIETKRTDVCEGSFSYEEAELHCLEKLIEIVEQSKSE